MDAEREQVAGEIGLREPIDFESDLRRRGSRKPRCRAAPTGIGRLDGIDLLPAGTGSPVGTGLVALEAVRLQQLQIGRHNVAASSTTAPGTSVVASRVAGLPARRAFGPTSD